MAFVDDLLEEKLADELTTWAVANFPKLPEATIREAIQAEVARLRAEDPDGILANPEAVLERLSATLAKAGRETLDIDGRLRALKNEWAKSTGQAESAPPPGQTFEGMTVGDLLEWSDHFIEADYPNTLIERRRLMGRITHMHLGRWGWGIKVRLVHAPEGDPLKVGEEVFRWGSTLRYCKVRQVPQ